MKTYILVVTIHDKRKEFVLPQNRNSDYIIPLQKKIFQALKQDILLKLDVLDGKWRLVKNGNQYLPEENEYCQERKDFTEAGYIDLKELPELAGEGERYSNGRRTLILCPDRGSNITLEFKSYQNLFVPYRKFNIGGQSEIRISSDKDHADIYWNAWGGWEARLVRTENGHSIICKNEKGFFRNGTRISRPDGIEPLKFGDLLDFWGLHLIYLGDEIAVEQLSDGSYFGMKEGKRLIPIVPSEVSPIERMPKEAQNGQKYQRSVREKLGVGVPPEELEIAKPKERLKEEEKPLIMTIGPSLSMMVPMALGCFFMIFGFGSSGQQTGMFRVIGLFTSVLSAVIGIIWTLLQLRYQKNKRQEEQLRWNRIHAEYFKEQYDSLKEKYSTTTDQLRDLYPESDVCIGMDLQKDGQAGVLATEYTCHHLWERNKEHTDFLKHRIGLGALPFQVKVHFQQLDNPDYDEGRHSATYGDYREAAEHPKYRDLLDVPILLDLKENPLIGIVGTEGEKSDAVRLAKALSAQIACWNCYTEVKLAFIYDEATSDDSGAWEFARWLPHVWSKEKNCRYIASNRKEAKDVFYALSNIFRDRTERGMSNTAKDAVYLPHYVVFISDPSLLYGEIFAKYAYGKEHNIGLTTIILTDEKNSLPNECTYIVELSGECGECYDIAESKAAHQAFAPDGVSDGALDAFARRLSRIQVAETEEGGELPDSLTFFDMLGVKNPKELRAKERWKKNKPYDHLEGLLGQMAGGAPCILDLHEKMHGPHGLVGGTTGSGKSETLQSYLLSLAVNYSPNDVAYFLIDYKGEGMAGLFERLPHKIGQMSNLSANQAERIMVSIRTENMRREQIFSENGVKNINEYRRLYEENEENGNSLPILPHLFIVIDEFAQLKKDNPEFIDQLISVSQVGRSLGVHLILATQTPGGGTVSGNIVSNSKFKICLRMQSKEDSQEMIGKKDAAYITRAGCGYLQVGMDELYEKFQTGYSGAAYFSGQEDTGNSKVLLIEEKPALVRIEGSVAKYRQKEEQFHAWTRRLLTDLQEIAGELDLDQVFEKDAVREVFLEKFYARLNAENAAAKITLEDEEQPKPDYERNEYMDQRILHLLGDYRKLQPEVRKRPVEEQAEELLKDSDRKYPEQKKETQFSATIQYLAQTVAADRVYQKPYRISKPLLKERIYLDEPKFAAYTSRFYQEKAGWHTPQGTVMREVVAGYADDPANLQDSEKQKPFTVDFIRDGNTVIYGRGGAGKSTLMQTLLYGLIQRYSPNEVRIYAADFDKNALAYFKDAPHVEHVIGRDGMQQFFELLGVLNEEMEIRRKKFAGYDYRKYLEVQNAAQASDSLKNQVSVFVFVDNFGEVARELQQPAGQKYAALLERILKESAGMGIYFVLSGNGISIKEIPPNLAQCMPRVLCLEMDEDAKYMQALRMTRLRIRPEKDVKGRGLCVYGKNQVLEFQAAVAVRIKDGEREEGRIEALCRQMARTWGEKELPVIGKRVRKVGVSEFLEHEAVREKLRSPYDFPIGYDEAEEVRSIPLAETNCFGICRYKEDGPGVKLFETCVRIAMEKQAGIILIDNGREWSSQFEGYEKARIISDEESLWRLMADDSGSIWNMFAVRNMKKAELFGKNPMQGKRLFEALKEEEPWFVFIKDMPWFLLNIIRPLHDCVVFNRWIMLWEKGEQHHIYTFAEFVMDQNEADILKYVPDTERKYKERLKRICLPEDTPWPIHVFFGKNTGIQLGGNLSRVSKSGYKYQFGEMSHIETEKPEKPEIGYLTDRGQGRIRIKTPGMQEGGNADGSC